jgi:hypothetical protein
MAVSYIRLGSTFAGQLSRRKQKVCVKRTFLRRTSVK